MPSPAADLDNARSPSTQARTQNSLARGENCIALMICSSLTASPSAQAGRGIVLKVEIK